MYLFAKYFILPDANEPQLTQDEYLYKGARSTPSSSSSSASASATVGPTTTTTTTTTQKDDTQAFPPSSATTSSAVRQRIVKDKEEDVVPQKPEAGVAAAPIVTFPPPPVEDKNIQKKDDVVVEKIEKDEKEEKDEDEEEDEDEDEDEDVDDDDDEEVDRKEIVISEEGENGLIAGAASLQGRRPANEDRLVVIPKFSETMALFAVFDGHNGASASSFCEKRFARFLKKAKEYPNNVKEALEQTYLKIDKKYIETAEDAGSTALVTLIHQPVGSDGGVGDIFVANAGDCRCVVSVYGTAKALSSDHKPDLPAEQERIKAANHQVKITTEMGPGGKRLKVARVDGELAVSRAIGDVSYKDDSDSLSPEKFAVTPFPEVSKTPLTASHKFMVMACDGLWDVMTNIEVVEFVSEKIVLAKTPSQVSDIASSLARKAINELGSTDNVSVIIVKF